MIASLRMEPSDVQSTAAETVESVTPQRAPGPLDLEDPSLYFNRELSWLDFNDRVLQLAEDPSVPLLERVKFCAIWESNLDEFYMVRVANLHDQLEAGLDVRAADGMRRRPSRSTRSASSSSASGSASRAASNDDLRPALAEHGIRIISPRQADAEERAELDRLFESSIFPALTPLAIGLGRPFPYISNLSSEPGGDPPRSRSGHRGRSPGSRCRRSCSAASSRWATAGGRSSRWRTLIAAQPRRPCSRAWRSSTTRFFRVTRDTDYDVSDEADDLLAGGRGGASPPPLRRGGPARGRRRR